MSDDLNRNKPRPPAGNAPRGSRRSKEQVDTKPSSFPGRPGRGSSGGQKKFMTQQQKEAMYQRWLYIGLAIAAGLIVLALGIGALWQYQIMPNQVLATVNGDEITRKDYWKYQDITLYNQARMYEDMALEYTGQEQSQFLLYATQLDAAREDVEGSTDVSEATIEEMIENKLYVQAAEEQGVDMSEPVLRQQALNTWAPSDAPLVTPIPSPTMIPERAAWATETAEAMQTQEAEMSMAMGTPMATPVAANSAPAGTPEATPVASPEATPDMETVESNARVEYQIFLEDVLADTGLSEEDYLELFAKPEVARAHIDAEIANSIPQSAPQVEVSHILVNTEELASELRTDIVNGDQNFEDAAAISSQDSATASNDGQLGWVMEDQLPEELDAVVFEMEEGEISEPIESPFGWHIVKVTDRDEDRPLSINQYDLAVTEAQENFLQEARENNDISSDHYDPSPAPTAEAFTPPMDAPTPVVATPVAAPDLSATPVAGPVFDQQETDAATPIASPVASPIASPNASPVAAP